MNILIVTNYILPHIGGVEVTIDREIEILLEHGHHVTVIASAHDQSHRPNNEKTHPNCRVITINAWNGIERMTGMGWPVFSPRLLSTLWHWTSWADAVHVHGYLFLNSLSALTIARMRSKHAVLTEHTGVGTLNSPLAHGLFWICKHIIGRTNLKLAQHVTCLNPYTARALRMIEPYTPVDVVPFSLNHSWLPKSPVSLSLSDKQQLREELSIPTERPLVLFIGRVVSVKGADLLLEAYDKNYELVFCGPASSSMQQQIQNAGARYLPPRSQSELVPLYQAADLVVAPSRIEGQAMSIYEALSCGCRVLIGAYQGSDFYAQCDGTFYTELNAKAIRQQIHRLIFLPENTQSFTIAKPVACAFPSAEQWERTMMKIFQGHRIRPRIIFVAFQHSIHTARWIEHLRKLDWDIHLFATSPWTAHDKLSNVTLHHPWRWLGPLWRWPKFPTKNGLNHPFFVLVLEVINRLWRYKGQSSKIDFPMMQGPTALNRLIDKLTPDMIHSLEFQHCGYLTLEAKRLYQKTFPFWIITNWGSDIYLFRHDKEHYPIIENVLQHADYYIAESHRDIALAQECGWKDKPIRQALGYGGMEAKRWQSLREKTAPSKRSYIMVKGYETFAGRGLTALKVIESCADILKNTRIIVCLADNPDVQKYVSELKKNYDLTIDILPYGSHDTMMEALAKSRILLSVSISDGVPATLLEAMTMGAFPIQTNSSAADEWIDDGKSGFLVSPDDVEHMASQLRTALSNDELVDQASILNWQTILEHADYSVTIDKVTEHYNDIWMQQQKVNQQA